MSGVSPWERGGGGPLEDEIVLKEETDEELIPLEATENEAEELIELEGGSEVDLIDNFVRRVGENLKRNLHWDKETILTSIREDILKRVEEELSRNRDRSILEKEDSILVVRKILNGYGDPKAIAGQYDGMAPRMMFARLILPVLVIVNAIMLIYVGRTMWESLEYLSEWNTDVSYFLQGKITFLTISLGSIIFVKYRRQLVFSEIEKEARAFTIACILLTSVLGGVLGSESVQLTRNWEEDGSEDVFDAPFPLENLTWGRGLFNNGSMFTYEYIETQNECTLSLHRWDRDLKTIPKSVDIPLQTMIRRNGTYELKSIESSGHFIHAWLIDEDVEYVGYWNETAHNVYILATFEGDVIGLEEFYSPKKIHRMGDHHSVVVQGDNATIPYYGLVENETQSWNRYGGEYPNHARYDALNLSMYSFSHGKAIGSFPVNISIRLSNLTTWNKYWEEVNFFPGLDTISATVTFERLIDPVQEISSYSKYRKTYYFEIPLNGSVLYPPLELYEEKRLSNDEIKIFQNGSRFRALAGIDGRYIIEHDWYNETMFRDKNALMVVEHNQTTGLLEINSWELVQYSDPLFRVNLRNVHIRENGTIHSALFRKGSNRSVNEISLEEIRISPNGEIQPGKAISLGKIPIFGYAENSDGDYDNLGLYMVPFNQYSDAERSYLFVYLSSYELKADEYHGRAYQRVILIIDDDGMDYYQYGYDPQPKQSRIDYFLPIIVGALIGLVFTYSLWDLGRRRLVVVHN